MLVSIFHPTEELKFTRLQKELISYLNDENTIWYKIFPLWIEFPQFNFSSVKELKQFSKTINELTFGELQVSVDNNLIFLPVCLKTESGSVATTLPLIYLLKNRMKNNMKVDTIILNSKINIPSSPNVFRLGIVQKELHNTSTSIQSCQTGSYILQDSIWFKKSK